MNTLGGISLLTVAVLGCGGGGVSAPAAPIAASSELRCPNGFESGPGGTCFALPNEPQAETPLLLLVHSGGSEAEIAEQLRTVRAATLEQAVVVFAQGSQSECALSSNVRAAFCWPAADAAKASAEWKAWERALWQAEALLPDGTHRRAVLALGDGAPFAAAAVREGALPVDQAAWFAPSGEAAELRAPGTLVQWFGADAAGLAAIPALERACTASAGALSVASVQQVLERLRQGVSSEDPSCGAAPLTQTPPRAAPSAASAKR